ncbi:MAG: hypothetical protein V7607_3229 [Solirubrobacteraceae bacterium]
MAPDDDAFDIEPMLARAREHDAAWARLAHLARYAVAHHRDRDRVAEIIEAGGELMVVHLSSRKVGVLYAMPPVEYEDGAWDDEPVHLGDRQGVALFTAPVLLPETRG